MLCGCSSVGRPTLHVAFAEGIPLPNGMIESEFWKKTAPLRVRLEQPSGRQISAELRAAHDGRAFSILVGWPDQTETVIKRAWVRKDGNSPWHLEEMPIDRLMLLFPLNADAPADLYRTPESKYDLWVWQAAWSDTSGYADDATLETKFYSDVPPQKPGGVVYPNLAGRGFIEQIVRNDPGQPGTISLPEPSAVMHKTVLPAAYANSEAKGSVTDVRATGKFGKQYRNTNTFFSSKSGDRTPGYWFGEQPTEERPGSYFVEIYRMLLTGDENDCQFKGEGPYRFSVAIIDNKSGDQPYLSAPLQLEFAPLPK